MDDYTQDRAALLRAGGAAVIGGLVLGRVGTAFAGPARAVAGPGPALTPRQALNELIAGNRRFLAGSLTLDDAIRKQRATVALSQHPIAMVLSCADSRVPPEILFDQGLGDIFDCRIAGNVLEPGALGSFEYAFEHFHSPLIVVLGHQRCGAVTATIETVAANGHAPGSIQALVDAIKPSVAATKRGSLSENAYVEAVVEANAKYVARSIPHRSEILSAGVASRKLRIVPAVYSLDTGKVKLLA